MNTKTIQQNNTSTCATPPPPIGEGRGEASTRAYATPPLAFGEGAGERFPGFPHPANELIEFLCGIGFLIVATTKKLVARHNAANTEPFRQWLTSHGVKDITNEAGTVIKEIYTNIIK